MSDVWVRVFDEENDAATYAEYMETQGYKTAVSDSSTVIKVRYSEAGTAKSLNIAGDGSNFVVMAFHTT